MEKNIIMFYFLMLELNLSLFRTQNDSYIEIQVNSLELLNENLQKLEEKNQMFIFDFQINNYNYEIYLFSIPMEKNITFK